MAFADHFSGQASDYARHRPTYPDELIAWLAAASPRRDRAWDCGTGSGQAAIALGRVFAEVVATDASAAQLREARGDARVRYAAATAEAPPFAARSIDLVTVAQAYHWFDAARFAVAVRAVARPDALVAAWSYGRCAIAPPVDDAVQALYAETLGAYWPPERALVEAGYRTIAFPFAAVDAPAFAMRVRWTAAQFLGYVRSWSAARRFHEATGRDAVAEAAARITAAWGDGAREVRWPLALLVGRVR